MVREEGTDSITHKYVSIMTSLIRKGKAFLIFSTVVVLSLSRSDAFSILSASRAAAATHRSAESSTTSIAMTNEDIPDPATFREAEVLALLLMQEGRHDDAIIGTFEVWVVSCFLFKYLAVWGGDLPLVISDEVSEFLPLLSMH